MFSTRKILLAVTATFIGLAGTAVPASAASVTYKNCPTFNKKFPNGVAMDSASQEFAVGQFFKSPKVDAKVYAANKKLDRTNAGLVCPVKDLQIQAPVIQPIIDVKFVVKNALMAPVSDVVAASERCNAGQRASGLHTNTQVIVRDGAGVIIGTGMLGGASASGMTDYSPGDNWKWWDCTYTTRIPVTDAAIYSTQVGTLAPMILSKDQMISRAWYLPITAVAEK